MTYERSWVEQTYSNRRIHLYMWGWTPQSMAVPVLQLLLKSYTIPLHLDCIMNNSLIYMHNSPTILALTVQYCCGSYYFREDNRRVAIMAISPSDRRAVTDNSLLLFSAVTQLTHWEETPTYAGCVAKVYQETSDKLEKEVPNVRVPHQLLKRRYGTIYIYYIYIACWLIR